MNTPEKDYTHKGWIAAAALIAVLVAVSFIPPQSLGGVKLRRANILSDLVTFDDAAAPAPEPQPFDEAEFHVDMERVAERIEADTAPRAVQTTFAWDLRRDSAARRRTAAPDTARLVEGDILTADLREKLQLAYGGGGTGFAPTSSPLTGFRRTVRTDAKGWTSYNIMQRKRAPETLRGHFYVSGWMSQPAAGASTRWESTDARQRLDSCTTAHVLFRSPSDSRVRLTLNDTLRRTFDIPGDEAVRRIVVRAPHLHALAFEVLSGTEGFAGYGAVFESDAGVVVDNYSVRSNNGQAMFWTDPSVNAQIDAMLHYDLVILQYGLNIMQAGVKDYSGYSRQIEKMVAYVRRCFPGAAVLVLGVSDRSVKGDAGFEPMDAIPHMTDFQRRAARNTGAAFWPTCDAMRAQGGMERFVQNGWAGKDFTHINYAGGSRVAWALVDALNDFTARHATLRAAEELRRQMRKSVLPPRERRRIERQLLPGVGPEPFNDPRR